MVALGTMLSSFWILCNNSWMQVPLGHAVVDGKLLPDDWYEEELADWRAGRAAVYQLAALTVGARLAVAGG